MKNKKRSILFVSIVFIILMITLFPYQLNLEKEFPILSQIEMWNGWLDFVLNVLLFIPFGFALALLFKKPAGMVIVFFSIGFSFLIESAQLFLPLRFVSIADLISNTFGGFLGFLIYKTRASNIIRWIKNENHRYSIFSSKIKISAFSIYCFLLIISFFMIQRQRDLDSWDGNFNFCIGNEREGNRPWNGVVLDLYIFDYALLPEDISKIQSDGFESVPFSKHRIFNYSGKDIMNATIQDHENQHICFEYANAEMTFPDVLPEDPLFQLDPKKLVEQIQKRDEFTILLNVIPFKKYQTGPARIVTFSRNIYESNFMLGQQYQDLVVRLRTGMTGKNGNHPQLIVPDVFRTNEKCHITVTYDTKNLLVYLNGKQHENKINFNYGALLFSLFTRIKKELFFGYRVVFWLGVTIPGLWLIFISLKSNHNKSKLSTIMEKGIHE